MSAIGSVIILPACFSDTWDLTNIGELAEADTAQAECAHEETLTATSPAAMDFACHEFRLFERLGDLVRRCHTV